MRHIGENHVFQFILHNKAYLIRDSRESQDTLIAVWQLPAMHNYFPEMHQVRYEAENGGRISMVTSGRFFFSMSANQLDSYYHLELLMSLVRETKPLSTPQQTATQPRAGGLSGGSAEHWQTHCKAFCQ